MEEELSTITKISDGDEPLVTVKSVFIATGGGNVVVVVGGRVVVVGGNVVVVVGGKVVVVVGGRVVVVTGGKVVVVVGGKVVVVTGRVVVVTGASVVVVTIIVVVVLKVVVVVGAVGPGSTGKSQGRLILLLINLRELHFITCRYMITKREMVSLGLFSYVH